MFPTPLYKRLQWTMLLLAVLSAGLACALAVSHLREQSIVQATADLRDRAVLVRRILVEASPRGTREIDRILSSIGRATKMRTTLIAADGGVLADSHEAPEAMNDHKDRPEVLSARAGTIGTAVRQSVTTGKEFLYIAFPPDEALNPRHAILRVARPLDALPDPAPFTRHASLLLLAVAAAAIITARRSALSLSRPLTGMLEATKEYESGNLGVRSPTLGSSETAELGAALNRMARSTEKRLQRVIRQRSEQEAILESMTEGVLAVDREERVVTLNAAAANLLGVRAYEALGSTIQEVSRIPALQTFVSSALKSKDPLEADITFGNSRCMKGSAAPIVDDSNRRIGAVIVLNDVTRLLELETMRRDFVANVSHELRTPITAIRGFIETLQEGGVNTEEERQRFLDIARRQSERLGAIIDDLLSLSRIERDTEDGDIDLASTEVSTILEGALESCRGTASQKKVRLAASGDTSARILANAALLEQALINLIDNAIKFSPEFATVEVAAEIQEGRSGKICEFRVTDRGPGIPQSHTGRLFERFYRVDKARSRKLGGTGLGLAIVKHIALAHGGTAGVRSRPGAGSTFWIRIPQQQRSSMSSPEI